MQTQSADYFTGIRDGLTALALDWGRSKLIDTENVNDTRNLPDYVDVREGQVGMSVASMVLIGAAVVLGVVLLKRVL